jgi:hypothetical protein
MVAAAFVMVIGYFLPFFGRGIIFLYPKVVRVKTTIYPQSDRKSNISTTKKR